MNLTEKSKILSFINEIDAEHLSGYVLNFKYDNIDGFETRIIQIFECLFKEVFLPENHTVYIAKTDEYKTPDFHALMKFDRDGDIVRVREQVLKLSPDDCDLLLEVAQETRNPLEHGTYKKSDESLKETLSEILYNALKNAYLYKTSKVLDVAFRDFLAALKYSKEQELEESNKELIESNEEKDKIIAELNEKLSLSIKKVDIKSEKPKNRASKSSGKKELKVEKEIKYAPIQKNDRYVIPKELGQNIAVTHSSHIDIAFDFLEKGWFEEAKKEVVGSTHPLAAYVTFLACNNLKNIDDIIGSSNYEFLLDELIKLLNSLPVKNVREIINQLIESFCTIGQKETNKKIGVFARLICFTKNNEYSFKDNFFNYLINSSCNFNELRGGFDLYFSSFKDEEYSEAIISAFNTMLKKHMFSLMFSIKDDVLPNFEEPRLIRILFMAQSNADTFESVFKGISKVFDSKYLSALLNFDFYNEKKEFELLKDWIISSIENSSKSVGLHEETNAIVLLNCVSQYLTEKELNRLIALWIDSFKNEKLWQSHTKECLLLIDLIKDNPSEISELIKCWFECSNTKCFSFYTNALSKAKSYKVNDENITKIDILLALSLTIDFKQFSEVPKGISIEMIENYLKLTEDYNFINDLLKAIEKRVEEINVDAYSRAFEMLLPYCKSEEKEIFNLINKFASKLVEKGKFDLAEKFFRYMLGLNINSSVCYWGLLFCNCKAKNVEELSDAKNLYDNELFQATLHSSKDKSPSIYKQCLDVYSTHKVITEKKTQRAKDKRESRLTFIVTLSQLISMFAFAAVGFVSAGSMWPFFILSGLILISIILHQTVFVFPSKRRVISGIVILCAEAISWTVLGGIHIGKAAKAESNYNELNSMMMNIRYSSDVYTIKNKISVIPTTYKDISSIKEEVKDLEWAFNRTYGREQFGKVNNFSVNHSNWDCSAYLYNYSFKSLFFGANWKVDDTNKTLSYYRDGSGERFSVPSSILPNNMQSGKEYYFYTEFDYLDDKNALVNQYMKFGYENKNDPTDKFLAYEFGYYHFNKDGQRRIEVYCYSDDSSHYLIYDSEY